MGTDPLSTEEENLNDILKELHKTHSNIKTYKVKEYRTKGTIANCLLDIYSNGYFDLNPTSSMNIELLFAKNKKYYSKELHEKKDNDDFIKQVLQINRFHFNLYNIIKERFGIENSTLIKQIMHKDYAEFDYFDNRCHVCGHGEIKEDTISNKINLWINYCLLINKFKQQINEDIPNWSKLDKKMKSEYTNDWKETYKKLSSSTFISNKDQKLIELNLFIRFLEKRHYLNQLPKVKAEFLLELNLPNINNLEIARKIVIYSSFSKNKKNKPKI